MLEFEAERQPERVALVEHALGKRDDDVEQLTLELLESVE